MSGFFTVALRLIDGQNPEDTILGVWILPLVDRSRVERKDTAASMPYRVAPQVPLVVPALRVLYHAWANHLALVRWPAAPRYRESEETALSEFRDPLCRRRSPPVWHNHERRRASGLLRSLIEVRDRLLACPSFEPSDAAVLDGAVPRMKPTAPFDAFPTALEFDIPDLKHMLFALESEHLNQPHGRHSSLAANSEPTSARPSAGSTTCKLSGPSRVWSMSIAFTGHAQHLLE
jgi:hypothetical protein